MKRVVRLTESDLHRIVKESVKMALNEGTTDSKISDIYFGVFDEMNGHDVASIIYNYLDEDAINDIVEYLNQNGYLEGTEFDGALDETDDEEEDEEDEEEFENGTYKGFVNGMEDLTFPSLNYKNKNL